MGVGVCGSCSCYARAHRVSLVQQRRWQMYGDVYLWSTLLAATGQISAEQQCACVAGAFNGQCRLSGFGGKGVCQGHHECALSYGGSDCQRCHHCHRFLFSFYDPWPSMSVGWLMLCCSFMDLRMLFLLFNGFTATRSSVVPWMRAFGATVYTECRAECLPM